MRLIDRVRRRRPEPSGPDTLTGFHHEFGRYTRFTADLETLSLVRAARAGRRVQEQYYVLDLLCDDGRATDLDDGFAVSEDVIAGLDAVDAAVLGLPPLFEGRLEARVHRYTASPDFRVELDVLVGAHPTTPNRRGPVLRVGEELYRLPTWALKALRAVEHHRSAGSPRSEDGNVRLVAELQAVQRLAEAESPGSSFSLGALDRFTTVVPTSVGLTVEPQSDGSLTVEPDLGRDVDASAAATRWHQVEEPASSGASDDAAVLRVDDTLVLLEDQQLAAVREVRQRSVIPAADVRAFLEAPGSFYDPELVDVDVRFSVRVAGLGVIAPVSFEQAANTGLDWFAEVASTSTPELLVQDVRTESQQDSVETAVEEAWNRGDTALPVGDTAVVDISDRSHVQEVLAASRRRLASLSADTADRQEEPRSSGRRVTVGMHILDVTGTAEAMRGRAAAASPTASIDFSQLLRQPFAHQRLGAEWMAGLLEAALMAEEDKPARIQGALLADDMGLGKTYMTLVALAEAQRVQRGAGREPLPTLGVMPVALLENWLAEIRATFGTRCGPFGDVVVLQGSGLADYRERGAERETAARLEDLDENGMVRADRIHASLRIGPAYGEARLDRPGVLVLTTYETLRRYQVSLGLVDWGVVVMDEAQAVKNPEILATRAAKALKARFKLLATGTPVENSLRDFWTLVDTAQPGLLSSWDNFHEAWVQPMSAALGTEHERLGKALRDEVGAFMLRRVKEDHLEDLPGKHVHEHRQVMPAAQLEAYDGVLAAHRDGPRPKGAALKALHQLASVSLHPHLVSGEIGADASAHELSARTVVTVRTILDDVRSRGEKAIVFAKTKALQRALALWLGQLYGIRVDVVNGETAATGGGETRLKKIRAFEAQDGFNVIIMSPLAAGVGLTVVGANHAVHLERHWNPAKEAQATDRIYRIGQTKDVHVHLPIAIHPDVDSFDVNLDRLLRSKVALKDAVVVPQEVTGGELESALGLT